MQRHVLGIIAVVLLVVGVATYGRDDTVVSGACLRVAAMVALLWLAMPQLRDVPAWLLGAFGVVLLIVLRWPKLLWAMLPLAAVLWLLRPRAPGAPAGRAILATSAAYASTAGSGAASTSDNSMAAVETCRVVARNSTAHSNASADENANGAPGK